MHKYSPEYIAQMRRRQFLRENEAAIEAVPDDETNLRWSVVFDRDAPVEIDLGCGDGAFLVAMAQKYPERNFLGIDRLAGRVRSVCRKVAAAGVPHVRVIQLDLNQAVSAFLPDESVSAFHFLFPDPWPKRRHWGRRTFNSNFLHQLFRALQGNGLLHLATDHDGYFDAIEPVVGTFGPGLIILRPDSLEFPNTTFEEKFRGQTIHRLLARKAAAES